MKIESSLTVDAPSSVVFRFFSHLDHLRFISPTRRKEWCPKTGLVVSLDAVYEVRVRQGRHGLKVRFRTVRYQQDRLHEDEFLSWPLRGARHLQTLEPDNGGTHLRDVNIWDPQWYLRPIVQRHEAEQRRFFDEKMENAKRVIEAVYRLKADQAFRQGIFQDASDAGIEPIIPVDGDNDSLSQPPA